MSGETTAPRQMPERRRRRKIRPAYVILAVLMALFAFKFVQKTQEIRRLAAQEAALQLANQQKAAENARLADSIRYYRTQNYVENEARAIFGYTKPGDVAIISQPVHQTIVRVRPAPPQPQAPPRPAWQQWWDVFISDG